MRRLKLKSEIVSLLKKNDLPTVLVRLRRYDLKMLINPLFSCLCHVEEKVRWQAISVVGVVVSEIADKNLEDARIIMRRFLWMLNDESGGIGWGVPEAMGEVMYHNQSLAEEYVHMLVSYTLDDGLEQFQNGNFLEMPLLQQGVLWGLCRIARDQGKLLLSKDLQNNISCYFISNDAQVRGLVCILTGLLRLEEFRNQLLELSLAEGQMRLYNDGNFFNYQVRELALYSLKQMEITQ